MPKTDMDGLMKQLFQLSRQAQVTATDLSALFATQALDRNQFYKKAGVGVVDKDVFVLLDQSTNRLRISDQDWTGKPSADPEIVFIKGTKVLDPADGAQAKRFNAVVFSQERVWVIIPRDRCGGFYSRG